MIPSFLYLSCFLELSFQLFSVCCAVFSGLQLTVHQSLPEHLHRLLPVACHAASHNTVANSNESIKRKFITKSLTVKIDEVFGIIGKEYQDDSGNEKVQGAYYSTQNFRNSRNRDKWYGNFLGIVAENPEIVEFSKNEPFNRKFRKFRKESQMRRKFPGKHFRKFGYT